MKVKDLIKKLKEFDPDSLVVLSSDSEGNSFSEAQDLGSFLFKDGEICKEEEAEEDFLLLDWSRSVVIYP